MMVALAVLRESLGVATVERSGRSTSVLSVISLGVAGSPSPSSSSYSKTSGMQSKVGEKHDERGVSGSSDMVAVGVEE
jgi:hypothetical protein